MVVLSTLFIAAVFAHGLFIWEEPIARLLALAVGFALLLLVLRLIAARRFRPRTVIELRRWGYHGRQQLESVVSRGRSMLATQSGLHKDSVQVELPKHLEPELVVWAHAVTAEGVSEPLAGKVHIELAEGGTVDGDLDRGRVTLWLGDLASSRQVEIAIVAASTDGTEES